jgi:hypothetical protein
MAFQHRRTREGPAVFCFVGYAFVLQVVTKLAGEKAKFCRFLPIH